MRPPAFPCLLALLVAILAPVVGCGSPADDLLDSSGGHAMSGGTSRGGNGEVDPSAPGDDRNDGTDGNYGNQDMSDGRSARGRRPR